MSEAGVDALGVQQHRWFVRIAARRDPMTALLPGVSASRCVIEADAGKPVGHPLRGTQVLQR